MVTLTVGSNKYISKSGESVLDTLLRENVDIPYGCRQGACQACMVRSANVKPPEEAQSGLRDTYKHQNHFLACLCHPEQDMTIAMPNQSCFYAVGKVVTKKMLNDTTIQLNIQCQDAPEYCAGQFVNLQRPDGLTRSYSIANTPQQSNTLELHIRVLPDGRFGNWVLNDLAVDDEIAVSEPQGHCFYLPNRAQQGILMVGTGSGLAPLQGILLDALNQGHQGEIHLFHGARNKQDLYHIEQMHEFAEQYDNFFYTPCISGEQAPSGFVQGRASDIALQQFADLKGWRVFLCGHPDMIKTMRQQAFMNGASGQDIYSDAFHLSES